MDLRLSAVIVLVLKTLVGGKLSECHVESTTDDKRSECDDNFVEISTVCKSNRGMWL